jgi:hypothetical protein
MSGIFRHRRDTVALQMPIYNYTMALITGGTLNDEGLKKNTRPDGQSLRFRRPLEGTPDSCSAANAESPIALQADAAIPSYGVDQLPFRLW